MKERVLGPKESPRRRWTVLFALTAALAFGLMYVAGAQAVHDDGVFELEANALTANDCTNPPANNSPAGCEPRNPDSQIGGEDWDLVFAETDSADSRAFEEDATLAGGIAGAGDSILSQDTKDIQPISGAGAWTWKQTASTSVQDKADIEHAYAAQYDDHLYFGADRYSNSGDTVMGFWFFRQEVGTVGPDAQGNGTFTGSHTAKSGTCPGPTCERGDILIVSDFRQGGKAPQIQVYEWVTSGGSASANLDLIGGSTVTAASCTQAPGEKQNDPPVPPVSNGDPLCATANQFVVTAPWEYDAKSNSGGTSGDNGTGKFGVATLMEGGIDLGAFGFGDTCFSSFMAETRAAHSVTSTLSDFVLGGFGECTSGITTTPKSGAGAGIDIPAGGISIGAAARVEVKDHAAITVTGTTGNFGGTVKFYICGPLALDSMSNCSTGGVQIGSPLAGETVAGTGGSASVTSDAAILTSAGRYCWRAEYSGDAGVGIPAATDPVDTTNVSECFKVNPVQPALATTAGADVTLTNPITDTANLTGTAKQPGTDGIGPGGTINATAPTQADADGMITWEVRGPNSCSASGLTVTGSPATVDGDGSYGPVSATPTQIGTYSFVASYDGDSPNTLGTSHNTTCSDANQDVTVTGVATLQTRQRWLPNDSAQITGPNGTTLSGNVVFKLFNDDECGADGGTEQYAQTIDVTTGTGSANSKNVATSNSTFHVTANNDGVAWSWLVSYNDANLQDPANECETTTPAFTLND